MTAGSELTAGLKLIARLELIAGSELAAALLVISELMTIKVVAIGVVAIKIVAIEVVIVITFESLTMTGSCVRACERRFSFSSSFDFFSDLIIRNVSSRRRYDNSKNEYLKRIHKFFSLSIASV